MEQYTALFTLTEMTVSCLMDTGRFIIIYSNGHMKLPMRQLKTVFHYF